MDMIGRIRRLHCRGNKSEREIARITGLSRNTVSKWLHGQVDGPPKYRRSDKPSKLTPFHDALKLALKADARRPRHERRTAKALYAEIKAAGYDGGYTRVTDFVRAWRHSEGQSLSAKAFVPLAFELGEAFQFDWSEDWAVLDGVRSLAEPLGLPCSGRPTMQALQAVWRQSAGEAVLPTFIQTSQSAHNPGLFMSRQTIKSAHQNTDQPVNSDNSCSARVPSSELPNAFRPGDQTAIDACPGTTARMPPPTPLLPGKPTE